MNKQQKHIIMANDIILRNGECRVFEEPLKGLGLKCWKGCPFCLTQINCTRPIALKNAKTYLRIIKFKEILDD